MIDRLDMIYDNDEDVGEAFYSVWNDLYGVRDMREIWFNQQPNPTKVEVVFQIKEIVELSLPSETLYLNAAIDIEWTDKRLSWTGFCNDRTICPTDYNRSYVLLNASRYQGINKGGTRWYLLQVLHTSDVLVSTFYLCGNRHHKQSSSLQTIFGFPDLIYTMAK